jgi:ubiquinone/menaquinone biosynthesis C-methylase UbiE
VTFDVAADAYDQFMGRYSGPLSHEFVALLGPTPGQDALDVGCGPGALTEVLVPILDAQHVVGVDPSKPFIAAARERHPEITFLEASAEDLPFDDESFDFVLAQLVVQFMSDPVTALQEMARVTRSGGTVGATVWDHAGSGGPLTPFWQAVRRIRPQESGESKSVGTGEGQLAELFVQAGLENAESTVLRVSVHHETFEDWWQPYTLGVGPAGNFVASLNADEREALERECRDVVGERDFDIGAAAWCVTASV